MNENPSPKDWPMTANDVDAPVWRLWLLLIFVALPNAVWWSARAWLGRYWPRF